MAKKKYQKDVHHRIPKSRGGTDSPINTSWVRKSHHRAYHEIFGTSHPRQIAQYLTEKWIDPNFVMIAVPIEDLEKVKALIKG